ncbi:hypothetical protein E0H51_34045 [Rhizobium leguminosarum bv. viciae]|uniref:hypothetical protein n=1 Tax=Rhizobium leguminosarum TaxID=384 RepID=UPI00103B839F|nr:hypothetical protein [Rhizobium leguminosarum]TBY66234.1 hypothetical protein E0H51_34045 [Rhizobium leguminosarum bv. viciae]
MNKAKKGRPPGAGYDKYLIDIADLIVASDYTKDLTTAKRELFPLGFDFHVTREAALKRISAEWQKNGPELLAAAARRATDKVLNAAKRKNDLLLMEAANELWKFSKMKVSPLSANYDMAITMFMPPATPDDYKQNPMVPLLMSFGEFQQAYKRRYIEQKRKEQRETAS